MSLDDQTWLVKARIDGEWYESRYRSKLRALKTAKALTRDYGLAPDEIDLRNRDRSVGSVVALMSERPKMH